MRLSRLLAGGLAAIGVSALAAGPAPVAPAVAAGEVLHLPPMMVDGKTTPLDWQYLELPGFQLLTVCHKSTATGFVRRTQRLGELLRVIVPDRFLFKSSVPETHILFNEEAGRLKSAEVMQEMLSEHGARLATDGTVVAQRNVDLPPVTLNIRGMGVRVPERQVLVMPNMRLWDLDTLGVFSVMPESRESPNFVFTEDRVQFLLQLRTPVLPDWFVEGSLGLYRRTQLGENSVMVLPAVWLTEAESEAVLRNPKNHRQLMTLPELLAYHRPARAAELTETDQVWAAQCALFVRWALAEKGTTRREALWRLVDRLETVPLTEALFQECFGFGFAEMHRQLGEYLPKALADTLRLEAPAAEHLPRLKFRPATELEIACIRGDWERMEIEYVRERFPALTDKYVEQARATLRRAHDGGERDPRLLALLGLTELEAGDKAAARDLLEAAWRGGKVRPRAALELARLRYAALPTDGGLTAAQIGEALAPLYPALQDAPPLVESYALLATAWARCGAPPGAEDLARLNEGARLFPRASAYILRVIYFNLVVGQSRVARTLAEAGRENARGPGMQEKFDRVLAALPP